MPPDSGDAPHDPRFAPPEAPPSAVPRRRILAQLRSALRKRLVVVVAPAGYGKTVLLAQAATSLQQRVRWITLEGRHDDATTLALELSDALGPLPTGAVAELREQPSRPSTPLRDLQHLLEGMANLPPTVLFLDDLHALTDPLAMEVVAALVEHAPRTVHVVVATRADPLLPLHRLYLTDALVELRQRDIAFTSGEASQLLTRISGREVSRRHVDALVERTEGWAVGLQLAAVSLREQQDVGAFVDSFTGDDRLVGDFLTEAVLERIPDQERDLLLTTSVLDELTPSLCDAVTGREGSHAILQDLDRRSMFVARLPQHRATFRCHGLFQAHLRHRLHRRDPVLEHLALVRAAGWYRARGDLDRAVRYFAEAGAWDEVIGISRDCARSLLTNGRALSVSSWTGSVPEEAAGEGDELALLHAVATVAAGPNGDVADALDALDVAAEGAATRAVAGTLLAMSSLLRGDPGRAASAAASVLAHVNEVDTSLLPPVDGLTSAPDDLAYSSRAIHATALVFLGDLDGARRSLREALDAGHPLWQLVAHASLALVEAWSGRLGAAERLALRALAFSDELSAEAPPGKVSALIALARVARERDDTGHAASLIDEARLRCAPGSAIAQCLIAMEEGRLALAEGDLGVAKSLLASYRVPDEPSFPDFLRTGWRAVEALLLAAVGDPDAGARSLALAPQRTLDVVGAEVVLAIERGDVDAAGAALRRWPDGPEPRASLERRLWAAVLEHLGGDEDRALRDLSAVVAAAEAEQHVGLLRGHPQVGPVRALYRARPTAFLRSVVEQPSAPSLRRSSRGLPEQLTEREAMVLALLPTRLTNAGIAEALGVSINTVKTHLRHVYQKLHVEDRASAVTAAERLRLL